MASEEHEEATVSVDLPPDLVEWLEQEADDHGQSREEFLASLLAAHRTAVADADDDEADLPGALERRFEEQHEEFTDLIEDVRKRVVQVKRETDAKAPEDHDHEALENHLSTLDDDVSELSKDVSDLESAVASVEWQVESGFDNYEEVLEYLTDETERLSGRIDVLAQALIDTRDELRRLSIRETSRAEAERLQLAANRLGIRSATCEECGESIEIGLLTEPECPHCASTFADVSAKDGFFGSHTLETGDAPALEGADDGPLDDDLDDLVDDTDDVDPPNPTRDQ